MPESSQPAPYHTLIHLGCGASPNLEEYRALAEHIWLIDADTQVLAALEDTAQAMENIHFHQALADTEKRPGSFYRYSLPWANGLAPLDDATQRLYPGLRCIGSTQQFTTPVDALLEHCLPEHDGSTENLLLLDVGHSNDALLQALEENDMLNRLANVIVLPAQRRARPVAVPPSLHSVATSSAINLTLPENSQVLQHHPLLQQLQHQKQHLAEYEALLKENAQQLKEAANALRESEAQREQHQQALAHSQQQLTEREKQLAELTQQRDEQAKQLESLSNEKKNLEKKVNHLYQEKKSQEVKNNLHSETLNPSGHNREMTKELNKDIRDFASQVLQRDELKPAYIDYLATKVIQIEKTCVGRLATTIQDGIIRQLVAESVNDVEICILEIGALYGLSLAILYSHAVTRFEKATVVCLDPLDGYYGQAIDAQLNQPVNELSFIRNMKLVTARDKNYKIIKKYSTNPEAIESAKKLNFNMLIIDGDHSYEGVKFDFDNYFPLLEPGGYVILDDYNAREWPGVQKFVDEDLARVDDFEYLGFFSRSAIGRKR